MELEQSFETRPRRVKTNNTNIGATYLLLAEAYVLISLIIGSVAVVAFGLEGRT